MNGSRRPPLTSRDRRLSLRPAPGFFLVQIPSAGGIRGRPGTVSPASRGAAPQTRSGSRPTRFASRPMVSPCTMIEKTTIT